MIEVGSRVKLRSDLPRSRVEYYSGFDIFPNRVYTVIRFLPASETFQYQLDCEYWAIAPDLVDCSFEVNLEKILE